MKYFLDERNLSPFRFRIKSILKIDIINIVKFLQYVWSKSNYFRVIIFILL